MSSSLIEGCFFLNWNFHVGCTLPETNVESDWPSVKQISSSNHPFSGAMLVLGRVLLTKEYVVLVLK